MVDLVLSGKEGGGGRAGGDFVLLVLTSGFCERNLGGESELYNSSFLCIT